MNRASPFALHVTFTLIWCAILGTSSAGALASGAVLSLIALVFLPGPLGQASRAYAQRLASVARLVGYTLVELVRANLQVAFDVVTPRRLNKPAVVAVPLRCETDLEVTLLSILITMTPGTIALDVAEDHRTLWVHAMFVGDADTFRRSISEGFERRVLEVLR